MLQHGPFGIEALRPQALFGADLPPLLHGALVVAFAQPLDLCRAVAGAPAVLDRAIAGRLVRADRAGADRADVPALAHHGDGAGYSEHSGAVSGTRSRPPFVRSLCSHPQCAALDPAAPADFELLQHAEHLIASSIGAASSRLVMSLLLRKRTVSAKAALKLLDDSHAALHFNREILQTALNHVRQGIAVFDPDLQLICSNRQFGEILGLPPHLVQIGIPLREILEFMGDDQPPRLRRQRSPAGKAPGGLYHRRRALSGTAAGPSYGDRGALPTGCPAAGWSLPSPTSPLVSRPPKRWNAPMQPWKNACAIAPRN